LTSNLVTITIPETTKWKTTVPSGNLLYVNDLETDLLTNANPLSRRSSAGCCGISLCITRLRPS